MYVGRVNGTVVATIKNETFQGRKLLIVEKLDLAGLQALSDGRRTESRPKAKYDIAVDMVQAGVGDLVLVLDEGNSARQIIGREPNGAIRAVVVGIVDEIALAEM
jgi:ethanolamine utilization protein EutN